MTDNGILTNRDLILQLVPRWLKRGAEVLTSSGISGKLLFAIAIQLDALTDATYAGMKRRFPGLDGQYDSLPLLGQERRIARGPLESDAGYAARLIPWQEAHRSRGGPYAMLEQLFGFWQGLFRIDLVNRTGKRFRLATDGTITSDTIAGWVDDKDAQGWAHWRLFYDWPYPLSNDGLWGSSGSSGDAHWGDGGLWGSSLTPTEVQNLLVVPTEWNCATTRGYLSLTPGLLDNESHLQDPGLICITVQ